MSSHWESVAKIEVDGVLSGTGFLVTKEYVLTALHVVAENSGRPFGAIRLSFGVDKENPAAPSSFETDAQLVEGLFDPSLDFALLKCTNAPPTAEPLTLTDRFRPFRPCSSLGFAIQEPAGFTIIGKISSASEPAGGIGVQFDFGSGILMKGHSGAPVMTDARVVGLLRTAFLDGEKRSTGAICFATSMTTVVEFCNGRQPGLLRYHAEIQWPAADPPQARVMADRKEEFEVFRGMISGRSKKRVLLLEGPSGFGKTPFGKELAGYAAMQPGVKVAAVDCKGGRSLRDTVESIVFSLRDVVAASTLELSGVAQATRLIDDLAAVRRPVLITFDTWEDSTPTLRDWVLECLLGDLDRAPAAVILITGREVLPGQGGAIWGDAIERRGLGPILEVRDWAEFCRQQWPKANIQDEHIEALLSAASDKGGGVPLPGDMVASLESLAARLIVSKTAAVEQAPFAGDPYGREKRLSEALEAAVIPHWFDDRVLAQLLDMDEQEACLLRQDLVQTSLVETFEARGGWNVQALTRKAMRLHLQHGNPECFRTLSARAARCWPDDDAASQIETLYHRLAVEPAAAAEDLRQLHERWERAGRNETMHALAVALEELEAAPLSNEALGSILLIVGQIQFQSTKLDTTERRARRAAALLELTGPRSAWGEARTLLGTVFEKRGDRKDALAEYEAAAAALEAAGEATEDIGPSLSLAAVYDHIGGVLSEKGKRKKALERHEQARAIRARLAAQHPSDDYVRRELAVSYLYIGSVLQEVSGDWPRALEQYLHAQRLLGEGMDEDQASIDWRSQLAAAHHHAGSVYHDQGLISEARTEYREFQRIIQGLAEAEPANVRWQRRLAVAHSNLGNIQMKEKHLEEALAEYAVFKEILERLTERDPDNGDVQRELAVAYNQNAHIKLMLKTYPQALEDYEASIRLLTKLCERDPQNTDWLRELSASRYGSGRVLQGLERREEALEAYNGQQDILAKLLSLDPENTRWLRDQKTGRDSIAALRAEMQKGGGPDAAAAAKKI